MRHPNPNHRGVKHASRFLSLAILGSIGLLAIGQSAGIVLAQSSAVGTATELEDNLFILNPVGKNISKGIVLVSIPQPIQKICVGKTHEQCATIDYCIRTTNPFAAMCQNLGVDLAKLRPYPAGMRPTRMYSITYYKIVGDGPVKGWPALQTYYDSQPKEALDRFSMAARVKARIKLTPKTGDDDFQILEILAAPPL
jgi:hypothetical protein